MIGSKWRLIRTVWPPQWEWITTAEAKRKGELKTGSLLAALDRNPVAESSSSGVLVGPDFEVHLADALTCWWREGAELCARAGWRFHPLVYNFHGASTGKLQKSLNRIFAGLSIG